MKFSYRARSSAGELRTGAVECADEREAARLLRRQGLLPVAIEAGVSERTARPAATFWRRLRAIGTVPLLQKALFFRELALFTAAGIPLGVSLHRLAEAGRCVPMTEKIRRVCREVSGGQSMSRAMKDSRFCEPVDWTMLAVGEETGRLPESLELAAERYERRERLRSQVISALTYPALVLFFSLAVLGVMFRFILPKFCEIFARLKIPVPALTARLFYVSGHLPLILSFLLAGLAAAAGAVWGLCRAPGARLAVDRLRLKVPVVGALRAKAVLARSLRSLGLMLKSGVPLLRSLELSAETARSAAMEWTLMELHDAASRGAGLAARAGELPLLQPVTATLIAAGEQTGKMDEMLLRAAEWHERALDEGIKRMTSVLEPLLIIAVGLAAAAVVAAVFLPVLQAVRSFS